MDAKELYTHLKKSQGEKGFLFPEDHEKTLKLLQGLLLNRQRYGYMSCPCRLASGDYEQDRDIICPCRYRQADIDEYGSCYCNLYVSLDWNNGVFDRGFVPERRPPEKMIF